MSRCFNASRPAWGLQGPRAWYQPRLVLNRRRAGAKSISARRLDGQAAAVANSLQDALRGAGLVKPEENKAARRKRRGPRRSETRRNTGAEPPPESAAAPSGAAPALSAAQARSLRARSQAIARDPWLSGARQAQALREQKERALLDRARSNRLEDPGAARPFHFARGRRIKSILVTEAQHRALLEGEIRIVGLPAGEYLLLPRAVAEEIAAQRPDTFVHRVKTGDGDGDGEDPGPAVPDELVW